MLGNLVGYLPWQLRRYRGLYGVTSGPRDLLLAAELENALVIVRDKNGWRDYSVAFSLNTPNLDGSVVYANDCHPLNEELVDHFPSRQVYIFDGKSVQPYVQGPDP
jgi:hypothetical protein